MTASCEKRLLSVAAETSAILCAAVRVALGESSRRIPFRDGLAHYNNAIAIAQEVLARCYRSMRCAESRS